MSYKSILERKLAKKVKEIQTGMAGVGMGNYVVDKNPSENVKTKKKIKK
jgi:hypothetical protein